MSELEKLREELERDMIDAETARAEFNFKMDNAMYLFHKIMAAAREIERQAGIGSDTNA